MAEVIPTWVFWMVRRFMKLSTPNAAGMEPQADPSIYLTSSLGITFPFNLLFGLPIYYNFAVWFHRIFA